MRLMQPNYVGILCSKNLAKTKSHLGDNGFLKMCHVLQLAPLTGVSCNTTRGTL